MKVFKNSLKQKIGKELINLLKDNASIKQISQWADIIYSNYCNELDSYTDELITKISFMQHGPEFVITRENLEKIAKNLLEK